MEEQNPKVDPIRWVEQYGDYLFNYAVIHLRDQGLAEELVQDALVAGLKSAESFKGLASEKSWLTAILKHKIIDHIRKISHQRRYFEDLDQDSDVEALFNASGNWSAGPVEWIANPLTALEQKDFLGKLNDCIQSLPDKQALVFTLREYDEMSTEEICNVLNVTATNLWVILHRARLRLRKCLEVNYFGEKSVKPDDSD